MTTIVIPILIISILIILNGIFVAAEFAIVAVPRTRIAQLAEEGSNVAQRTLKILLEPSLQNRYIATAQVGITIVSLGLGMYGEEVIAHWLESAFHNIESLAEPIAETLATILAVGILTYFHVVIGEMIPKSLALQSSEPTALRLARPMAAMERLFLPIVAVLNGLGNLIIRLIGIPQADTEDRLFTPEELEFIVEESSEGGLLDPSEQLFIENIFDLQERTVEQVMTPRTQVVGISADASEKTIMQVICETRKSRYPIYDPDLDHIIGLLHIKDFARHQISSSEKPVDLRSIMRPVSFIPETLQLGQLLIQFRIEQIQFGVAVDEFGGTAGIVTIEDLVEEVVGEIQDEFDREILPIEVLETGMLRVRGDLLLDELNQHYDVDLEMEDAFTVGGLVMTLLGRIPTVGDRVVHERLVFQVEAIERLAVQSVLIELPLDGQDPPEA
jgi:CBS domain containing-hemolysin-like protein